jgi:SPX domain protein involved in polyphosphate accumulation
MRFRARVGISGDAMHIDTSHVRRFEWKYRVPAELVSELTEALQPRTDADSHCVVSMDGAYPVRSLYYDTADLRFYHEKKDGVKVRRKLRVRNYGDDLYFLEIKRKINKKVVKERVSLPRSEVSGALDGVDPAVVMLGRPDGDLQTLERFRFNMRSLGLIPTVLIAYRRRAWVGRLEPHLRITLDSDLRCHTQPVQDAIFEEIELRPFEERCVLELKFDGRPPRWLMDLMSELQLKRESYSKYCEGIDSCPDRRDSIARGAQSEASRR